MDMKDLILLSGLLLIVTSSQAHAYIDPVTGSFVIQAIVGGIAAAMVAIKRVRMKLLSFLGVSKTGTDDSADADR